MNVALQPPPASVRPAIVAGIILPGIVVRQIVCEETAAACAGLTGLDAIILTGSMARDEASIANDHGMTVVRGDAEFLLVFAENSRVPAPDAAERIAKKVEERLLDRNLRCRVCLSPVSTMFLEEMVPNIFGYELRSCGQVIWGDANALARVPAMEAARIPLDDAVRLLCNRMIELLELVAVSGRGSKETQYATVKLYLDMATSFLVFAGAYQPTYRRRIDELNQLAATMPVADAPFSLSEFTSAVEHCTCLKLASSDFSVAASATLSVNQQLIEGVRLAHRLWQWELVRLLKLDPKLSDEQLLACWASSQPWTVRLRGWARVLRDADGAAMRRNWMRWLRLAVRNSPRQSIYAAGCQLFFRLPNLLRSQRDESLTKWRSLLPVIPEVNVAHPGTASEWAALAAAIARNYHQFVEFTRT
ncbi:MAG TPA: hypothetical protein VGM18_19525 [Candidatus Sulfotelmatobacter sp.]